MNRSDAVWRRKTSAIELSVRCLRCGLSLLLLYQLVYATRRTQLSYFLLRLDIHLHCVCAHKILPTENLNTAGDEVDSMDKK